MQFILCTYKVNAKVTLQRIVSYHFSGFMKTSVSLFLYYLLIVCLFVCFFFYRNLPSNATAIHHNKVLSNLINLREL